MTAAPQHRNTAAPHDRNTGHPVDLDLDHALLSGASGVLWSSFLVRHGLLLTGQLARYADLEAAEKLGTTSVAEFNAFACAGATCSAATPG